MNLQKVKYRVVKENRVITSPLSRSLRIRCYPLRKVVPNYYSEGDLWEELSAFTGAQKIEITGKYIFHLSRYRISGDRC